LIDVFNEFLSILKQSLTRNYQRIVKSKLRK